MGDREVELLKVPIVLFSRKQPSTSTPSNTLSLPSILPFSIPLQSDTPQCIHTPRSSLSHVLTATLHPINDSLPPITRSVNLHTRRYTSHLTPLTVSPHKAILDNPAQVEVELPRTVFRINEPLPIYVTIPPPPRTVVLDHGLTLRNVRAELVCLTTVTRPPEEETDSDSDALSESDSDSRSDASSSNGMAPSAAFAALIPDRPMLYRPEIRSSEVSEQTSSPGILFKTVIAHSGAACRFHSSLPVRLRFVLFGPQRNLNSQWSSLESSHEGDNTSSLDDCPSITQETVLHNVSFQLRVHVTFLHSPTHSERVSSLEIPITIIPSPAPLPEIDPSLDNAYRKKHDRPPAKTVRMEDHQYSYTEENAAGPSGAPPPFEDAPPPFFAEPSTSRLPTFLESETEIYIPSEGHPSASQTLVPQITAHHIEGEGSQFGFPPGEQYDGHSDEVLRLSTPPPTIEMAGQDTNVTDLADLVNQPDRALEALNMAIEAHDSTSEGPPPPPPPPMDDPSDPPPSIDSAFRSVGTDVSVLEDQFMPPAQPSPAPSPVPYTTHEQLSEVHPSLDENTAAPAQQDSRSSQAPPPYLTSNSGETNEHVNRPPPYMDLLPSGSKP